MKKCCFCNELLNLSEFNKHSRSKDGLQTACRKCYNILKEY